MVATRGAWHFFVALVALFVLCAAQSVTAQEPNAPYDPFAGMDPNGRIPKPQLPDGLPNRDRWRYTPEGRMPPGNMFERFLVSSFFSPILFREEDIGVGGGVAITDLDFRNQRYREFANLVLTYSSEGQQAYTLFWARWLHHRDLPDGGIVREERGRLFAHAGYEKTLTRRFFGFGSRSALAAETSYTEETTGLGLGIRDSLFEPGGDWLYQAELNGEHHGLSSGRVKTLPSTEVLFPDLVADGDGDDLLWLTASLGHDTRDSIHQPYAGHRVALFANAALATGGETGAVYGAEARQYFALPPLLHHGADGDEENPPTDLLALAAFVEDTTGDLPYYSLPSLGGSATLRSFVANRFTDRAAAHGSAEYRFNVIPRGFAITRSIRVERLGLALFYDLGTVAPGLEDLDTARWHRSYGFGLRIAFAREAMFRVDIGYGDEGSNFTLAFGNSF